MDLTPVISWVAAGGAIPIPTARPAQIATGTTAWHGLITTTGITIIGIITITTIITADGKPRRALVG
jgi:hypothetical protein